MLVVVLKRLAKGVGDLSVNVDVEVVKLVLSEVRATEGDLEGEAVDYPQFFPQGDLSLLLFTLAAPSLSFCTSNAQSLNWKTAQLFFMSMGKTCSFFDPSLEPQPSVSHVAYI